jgi:cell pole-organizing protein PopZ
MEEILASIRRIIADEDPAPNESPPAATEAVGPEQGALAPPRVGPRSVPAPRVAPSDPPKRDDDIDSMLAQLQATSRQAPASAEDPAHAVHTVDEPAAMRFDTRPSEPATPRSGEERRPVAPKADDRGLMSAATTAAVESAFHSLAETAQVRSGRTLEDVVSDILRPMLKAWLDENLPGLVERLVRAEIERVARGKG